MVTFQYNNVIIRSLNGNTENAILFAHGGYTPPRCGLFSGSGRCIIPVNITIHFNASHDNYGVYTHGTHLLNGRSVHMMETVNGGSEITNYSLTHHDTANKDLKPTAQYDLILIAPTGKAHMDDVFYAIQGHGLRYRQLYIFACRINKRA